MTKSEMFRDRASEIATSFDQIKKNPLDLNLMMIHVGMLSLTLDEMLRESADILEHEERVRHSTNENY